MAVAKGFKVSVKSGQLEPVTITIQEATLEQLKLEKISQLDADTRNFIIGYSRYTIEKQTTFNTLLQLYTTKLQDPNISDEEKKDLQQKINRIKSVLDWIQRILDYHVYVQTRINEAKTRDELESISWDFSQFEATDPRVKLRDVKP